ncbi:MAG: hypothetical protein ACI81R_001323 [Bradymonadia bacterium]|jgi:hypothetical protein
MRALLALAASATLFACGEASVAPAEPSTSLTWHQDVSPIIAARCATCHVDGGVAPFSLQTLDDVMSTRPLLATSVRMDSMPPWQAAPGYVEYRADLSLTEREKSVLLEWLDSEDTPLGDPANPGAELPAPTLELEREDILLTVPEAYTPPANSDDYRCFIVDWPADEPLFVTGTSALPGAPSLSHHMAIFLVGPDEVQRFLDLDEADPGLGYECFGAAAGDDYFAPYELIGGWAPGGGAMVFPEGTGIPVAPGSIVILQQHYNTLFSEPESDQSSMVFEVTENVEREAHFIPFLDWSWVLAGMEIEAGVPDVTHSYVDRPDFSLGLFFPNADARAPLELWAASPHMHLLGQSVRLDVVREDETVQPILDLPIWDFGWQRVYWFQDSVTLGPQDKIQLTCRWDNSAENQPIIDGTSTDPRDVGWGEGTFDEMCLSVIYVTQAR